MSVTFSLGNIRRGADAGYYGFTRARTHTHTQPHNLQYLGRWKFSRPSLQRPLDDVASGPTTAVILETFGRLGTCWPGLYGGESLYLSGENENARANQMNVMVGERHKYLRGGRRKEERSKRNEYCKALLGYEGLAYLYKHSRAPFYKI